MIHVCMICLYMCPCYGTCVWVKEQHWVLVLASAIFEILSHSWFASVGSRLAGLMGMQSLYSLPLTGGGSAGLIDPLHQTQLCVIMGIWTQAPHLHSKHLTCSAIFPPWDWPFVSSFDNSQMVVRDQLHNGG